MWLSVLHYAHLDGFVQDCVISSELVFYSKSSVYFTHCRAVPGSSVLKARLEEVRSVTSSLDPAQRMALLKSADFADLDSKAIDLILGSGVGLEDDWKVREGEKMLRIWLQKCYMLFM